MSTWSRTDNFYSSNFLKGNSLREDPSLLKARLDQTPSLEGAQTVTAAASAAAGVAAAAAAAAADDDDDDDDEGNCAAYKVTGT